MNEQEQIDGTEAQPIVPEIDYEKLSGAVAEKLAPVFTPKQEELKETPWTDLDYDERESKLKQGQDTIAQQVQQVQIQQEAMRKAPKAVDDILSHIPEELRGEGRAVAQELLGTLNPADIANGLNPDFIKLMSRTVRGTLVEEGKAPSNEPKAQLIGNDIPFADEIIRAFEAGYGRKPSLEEIQERSKTWATTRAS